MTEERKTILQVEDEAIIALSGEATLREYGFNVITVNTGEKAVDVVKNGTPVNLVLMDIDLGRGRMDGTEAAEIILRQKDLPIVFCTSHTEKEMVERVKGITRYGYVLKSSGEFVLLESINMAFELYTALSNLKTENNERRKAEETGQRQL